MKTHYKFILLASIVIFNCNSDEPQPTDIIINGNMETGAAVPTGWASASANPGAFPEFESKWTDDPATAQNKVLNISTQEALADNFAYWYQQKCNDIPRGKTLVLKAKVKGTLTGQGISIAIRCDDTSKTDGYGIQFVTTQNNTPITGTFDWKEYSVEIGKVEQATTCIWVFLVYLPNTTGDVFFDDVSLTYH